MPRKSQVKSKKFYTRTIKELRKNKAITWNVDLRKKLNPGQKAAITKASKTLRRHRSLKFIPVERERGESKSAFKKRLSDLKSEHNQQSNLAGVFAQVPKRARGRIEGNEIITKFKGVTEKVVSLDPIELLRRPKTLLKQIIRDEKPGVIFLRFGPNKSNIGFDVSPDNPDGIDDLVDQIKTLRNRYGKKEVAAVITGAYLVF